MIIKITKITKVAHGIQWVILLKIVSEELPRGID